VSPLHCFAAKFAYLTLMGCAIGPFDHRAYSIYFWAFVQSITDKLIMVQKLKVAK
jgi:hypothetical protein